MLNRDLTQNWMLKKNQKLNAKKNQNWMLKKKTHATNVR